MSLGDSVVFIGRLITYVNSDSFMAFTDSPLSNFRFDYADPAQYARCEPVPQACFSTMGRLCLSMQAGGRLRAEFFSRSILAYDSSYGHCRW